MLCASPAEGGTALSTTTQQRTNRTKRNRRKQTGTGNAAICPYSQSLGGQAEECNAEDKPSDLRQALSEVLDEILLYHIECIILPSRSPFRIIMVILVATWGRRSTTYIIPLWRVESINLAQDAGGII